MSREREVKEENWSCHIEVAEYNQCITYLYLPFFSSSLAERKWISLCSH